MRRVIKGLFSPDHEADIAGRGFLINCVFLDKFFWVTCKREQGFLLWKMSSCE